MRLRTPIPARPHSSVSASSVEAREVSAVWFAEESSDDMMLLGWPSEERLVGVDSPTGLLFRISGVIAPSIGSSSSASTLVERLRRFRKKLEARVDVDLLLEEGSVCVLGHLRFFRSFGR